ncbi:helix-turn-helix transcriptional regulator [bacterium]|nr:helix-turn-helix transcriptional regulator [bacterium]
MSSTTAAELLRTARLQAGMSQSAVAQLAKTSQSAIATYEAGNREPSLPVLQRLLAATGHQLSLSVSPDTSVYRIADLALDIAQSPANDDKKKLRYVFEFMRGAQEDTAPVNVLVSAEPKSTGDMRFDALLAGIAEDLCVLGGEVPPQWVNSDVRTLKSTWWVSSLAAGRAQALVHCPAALRRRGVMIDRHDLEGA